MRKLVGNVIGRRSDGALILEIGTIVVSIRQRHRVSLKGAELALLDLYFEQQQQRERIEN